MSLFASKKGTGVASEKSIYCVVKNITKKAFVLLDFCKGQSLEGIKMKISCVSGGLVKAKLPSAAAQRRNGGAACTRRPLMRHKSQTWNFPPFVFTFRR